VLLPSDNVNEVEIAAVDTAVTLPFASTVSTGIAVELPTVPALTPLFASVVDIVAVSPALVNVALPVASPDKATVTALDNASASSAVPVKLPVTLPVTSPTKSAVTVSNDTLAVVATSCPIATEPEVIVTPVPPVMCALTSAALGPV
jgi:hypothetical protein